MHPVLKPNPDYIYLGVLIYSDRLTIELNHMNHESNKNQMIFWLDS